MKIESKAMKEKERNYPKKSSWRLIRAAQPCGSGSE